MRASDGSIAIRPLRPSAADMAALARWLSDPRVLEFYEGRDHPFSLADVRREFAPRALAADGVQACLILLEGNPLGYLQYEAWAPPDLPACGLNADLRAFGMDLFIGEPQLWGRGLGRRAVQLAAGWLLEHAADCVTLDPHVDNERAVRCYSACGFEILRRLPAHELHEGRRVDCWLMVKRGT